MKASKEEYLMLREEILSLGDLENNVMNFFYVSITSILAFSLTQKDTIFILLCYMVIMPSYRLVLSKEIGIYKIGAYLYVFHEGKNKDFIWERRSSKFHAKLPKIFKRVIPTFNYPFIYINTFVTILFFLKTNWMEVYIFSYELFKILICIFLNILLIHSIIINRYIDKSCYIPIWNEIKNEESARN